MANSKGLRRKTRDKLKGREGNIITKAMQRFKVGDLVAIDIDSRIQKGMPHPRFQGLTGRVKGGRGSSYSVEVVDGKKLKELIVRAEHLKSLE
jgi:large subunit ribosomal protein L21e